MRTSCSRVSREESTCEQLLVRQLRQLRERCEVATVIRRREGAGRYPRERMLTEGQSERFSTVHGSDRDRGDQMPHERPMRGRDRQSGREEVRCAAQKVCGGKTERNARTEVQSGHREAPETDRERVKE
jgi:xanthine/CO dehydrogenase XdhC/CoxF family maturation factor